MTLTHGYVVRISRSRGIFPGKAQKLLDHSNVEGEYYHKERFSIFSPSPEHPSIDPQVVGHYFTIIILGRLSKGEAKLEKGRGERRRLDTMLWIVQR